MPLRIFAECPLATLVLDAQSGIVRQANPAARALYGLEDGALLGQPYASRLRHPGDWGRVASGRLSAVGLQYHLDSGGRPLPVSLQLRWPDEAAADGALLVFVHDLSASLAADQRRLLAERNYTQVFDAAPLPLLLLDRERVIVEANVRAHALYAMAPGMLPHRPLIDLLVAPGDLEAYRLVTTARTLPRQRHRCFDGHLVEVEATLSSLRRERESLMLVALYDMTATVQQVESLRQAEERWRFALDGHGDGVWEWLPRTGAATVSQRFLDMLGFGPEDAARPFDYWDARTHPDDYLRMHQAIMQHFLGEQPEIAGDFRMMTIDGQYRWLSIRARAIERDRSGYVERLIGSVRDVHEQRLQAQRERLHEEQLMHTARLAIMGELVTVIAHEVTQPLTAISNFAAVARHHAVRGNDPAAVTGALERIGELVRQTGEVVHRIRSFVRKGEVRREAVALNTVVVDVMRLADLQARECQAEIVLELGMSLPLLQADRMQLGQMVLNLARNGLESMQDSDGLRVLTLRTFLNATGELVIEVQDAGCGLPQPLAMDVFTPFKTTKPDGLGVGLSICKTVVDNHHGRLWATPVRPNGTVFHVALPIEVADA